ncbi:MAG: hypothetical protein AAF583_01005 [Pseudomonadota bacterium]
MNSKTVLITSPQEWGHIRVSKHHYAEEVARAGANVLFLNPPSKSEVMDGVAIEPVDENFGPGSISVIHWNRHSPVTLRFKAPSIYKQMIKRDIRRIFAAIDRRIDLLWSFDPNTFPDLTVFDAGTVLYMPVDPLSQSAQVNCAKGADLIVSISKEILDNFEKPQFKGRTLLVDHGISRAFEAEAKRAPRPRRGDEPIRAAFFGNLDRPIVNHKIFAQLAAAHRDVDFHFWGPFDTGGLFQQTLGGFENIIAHGALDKPDLVEAIRSIDVFLLIYGVDKHLYDRSNAHKILEYLSTGKVVVSSAIARYAGRFDLLRAPSSGKDEDIPALFADTISELDQANAPDLQSTRKAFALEHSYRSQLDRIEYALEARTEYRASRAAPV